MDNVESVYAKDRRTWRRWLTDNHKDKLSVWLVFDKGKTRKLSYDAIVEEALCFGWVDSRPGLVSDTQSKLYISQRKTKSVWSKSNKERIDRLSKLGLIMPAGQTAVEIAKTNGSWDALNKSDALEVPKKLQNMLSTNKAAREFYESMSPSSKKNILEWIYSAKKKDTRDKRIQKTVELASLGVKAHPNNQK